MDAGKLRESETNTHRYGYSHRMHCQPAPEVDGAVQAMDACLSSESEAHMIAER